MLVDVAFLWEWEFDEDFINILDRKCFQFGLQSFLIHPFNLADILKKIQDGSFVARVFYDRASDGNPAFEPVVKHLLKSDAHPLNDPANLEFALDKANMHGALKENGIHVPYTIILSPWRDWTKIKIGELLRLGEPFIIKPALGGGGVGVELNANGLFDIVKAREGKSKERFLLQEKVLPIQFADRRAWFRVFYVCGNVIICWWDDHTHLYQPLQPEEESVYGLENLRNIAVKIAGIAHINFFSAEVAIVDRETFVVVDYVNDQCDMRLKSRFHDGVPDDVVEQVAFEIAQYCYVTIQQKSRTLRIAEGP